MVLAYHLIISAYGFWLPNDPRGSWSEFIRKWELLLYGPATQVTTRRSVANRPTIANGDWRQVSALNTFLPSSSLGFSAARLGRGLPGRGQAMWLCGLGGCHLARRTRISWSPDTRISAERIVMRLKAAATTRLVEVEKHPFQEHRDPETGRCPRVFSQGEWKVFLTPAEDIVRSIGYVEKNPEKEGKLRQRGRCVTQYKPDGLV